jgi:hypothetical protein
VDNDRVVSQPKSSLHADTEWQRREQFDVAAAATEVGGFQLYRNIAAFRVEFDRHPDGVTRMAAAFMLDQGARRGQEVRHIHQLAPGLGKTAFPEFLP